MAQKTNLPNSPLYQLVRELHQEHSGDALDILRLIWTIEHDVNTLSKRTEIRQGIAGSHRAVLQYVALVPGISAGKLAELLLLHPSTLSNVFKKLIASGMIERKEDADDLRKMRLYPTPKGLEVLRVDTGTVQSVVNRVVDQNNADVLASTRKVLQQIADELRQEVERGSPEGNGPRG